MAFDFIRFFTQYNIAYVERGPNVARGNVNIQCPFCGVDDPSHHMGVSIDSINWGCWRRKEHRGRNPARLVQALLRCSSDEAKRIVGHTTFVPEDFLSMVQANLDPPETTEPSRHLCLLDEFKPIGNLPSARLYTRYLRGRGFAAKQILRMTEYYDLLYCTRGPYRGRIIFPITMNGKLVSWTGRSVYPGVPRYKSLTTKPEKAQAEGVELAIGAVNHYLLWYDDLEDVDADTIYVVEGPFDALKVTVLGAAYGIVATCLFTSAPTPEQVELLNILLPRFKHQRIMLDRDMFPTALRIASQFPGLLVKPQLLPKGVKDPGELTSNQLLNLRT